MNASNVKNIVLVHGGFVDGSGWERVYAILKKKGYEVSIVQNPTTSLADDVAATNRTLAAQDGPAVLVGHSYGGVVITEAGNNPKVARLASIQRAPKGRTPMLRRLALITALAFQMYAQAQPPRVLYISREFWKPGTQAALNRIEAKGARMCVDFHCPHPYLGIESLTGSKEVWYVNGFTSSEEVTAVAGEYEKRGLFARMNQFTQERARFRSEPDKAGSLSYRPELSHGVSWNMGQGRFLVILVTKGKPQSDGTVFETEEGERFVVTPAQTLAEAEAKLSSAGQGAKIFAVRPHFSMPAPEWVAADASFWRSSAKRR